MSRRRIGKRPFTRLGTVSFRRYAVHPGFKASFRHGLQFVVNKKPHHRDAPVKVGELQVCGTSSTTR